MIRQRGAGFTLVELICVLLIIGSLASVAMPGAVNLTGAAYHAQVAGTAAAFESAVRLVNVVCVLNSWANKDNLPGYGNGTVDFNTACYPTDTTGNANVIGSTANRCARVWGAILLVAPTVTTGVGGADYRATARNNVCTFRYLLDSSTSRQFRYNALTGAIVVSNP